MPNTMLTPVSISPGKTERRFWNKVDRSGGPEACWIWTAYIEDGYGRFWLNGCGMIRAHRVAYELLVGPIPEGLQIDHLCRNRGCVNPKHMEPVTQRVNILRGNGIAARRAVVTVCPQGHPYDEANTYIRPSRTRGRECRACSNEHHRRAKSRP